MIGLMCVFFGKLCWAFGFQSRNSYTLKVGNFLYYSFDNFFPSIFAIVSFQDTCWFYGWSSVPACLPPFLSSSLSSFFLTSLLLFCFLDFFNCVFQSFFEITYIGNCIFYFPELFLILRIFLFIASYSCLVGIIFLLWL